MIDELLRKYPVRSDQIDAGELRVILSELLRVLESDVQGDVVEFGCYKGTTSVFLARIMVKFWSCHPELVSGSSNKKDWIPDQVRNDKRLFLYDSFEGLPAKTAPDQSRLGEQFRAGKLLATKRQLLETFAKSNLPRPVVKKAWFRDLADRDLPPNICFAFFDGDFYESIRDSFAKCGSRFSAGATIVVDDYANEKLPGAATAVDEWRRAHSDKIKSFHIEKSLAVIRLA